MQLTKEQVLAYIGSKKFAWSKATQRSELARLLANLDLLNQGPEAVIAQSTLKAYSLKTLFIRAGELFAFCNITPNRYKDYLRHNALQFKNSYERVVVEVSYESAREKISKLTDERIKRVAFAILSSGLRSSEALKYDGSGQVLGKGAKRRDVFIDDNLAAEGISYMQLYRGLKRVGLKPHDLRKLAATKLAGCGVREADLMTVFGWSSMQTASYYLQSKHKNELKTLVNSVLK